MALVACCLWCAPASSAHLLQDSFPAELELVAVPVFVTDDRGRSVPGLTAADFTIEDEGERVPIRAFVAVDAASSALARASGGAPRLRAAVHRQFLLLFDLTFSTPSGVVRARDGALAFLEKELAPNDLVAVATLRPTGVQLLVGFTPDVRQAVRAVAHLHAAGEGGLRDPLGLARELGVKLTGLTSFQGLPPENDPAWETVARDRFLQELRANREAYSRRVIGFLSALGELGQLLGALEGRKQIILFSAGYDQTVLSGVEHAERVESSRATLLGRLWEVQPEAHFGDHRALGNLDRLMDGLGASDVVVHTVDVTGLSAAADPSGIEQGRRASGAGSLSQLAEDSGGRFIRNANDLARGLGEILDASRFFYVVGFEPKPGSKDADEPRRLDISVARPALHVSHRRGYVLGDERGRSVPARRLRAAEAIAKGLSTGAIGLGLMAMPYHRKGVGPELPVVLQVDGRSLLDGRAGESLEIEVYGYALDESGRILDAIGLRPTLDLSRVGATVQETGV